MDLTPDAPAGCVSSIAELPVQVEDRDSYVVWDLREWEGDIETMEAINEAWVEVHEPAAKQATVSVFPSDVVVDEEKQSFITDGWNEACELTGIECIGIVSDLLKGMAVKRQIDVPGVAVDTFDEVTEATEWVEAELARTDEP